MKFALLVPSIAALFAASGCSFLWESHPLTALPSDVRTSSELDPLLPEVLEKFHERTPQIKVVWLGNTQLDWHLDRHKLSGNVVGKSALFRYVFQLDKSCAYNDAYFVQEHISDGTFGKIEIRGAVLSSDGTLPMGDPIDCAAAKNATVGYRPGAG